MPLPAWPTNAMVLIRLMEFATKPPRFLSYSSKITGWEGAVWSIRRSGVAQLRPSLEAASFSKKTAPWEGSISEPRLAQTGFVLQYRTMARPIFGSLELTILLAVSRLGEDAYGLTVRDDISARTGHDYSVGAVYTTLQRLEEKRLVSSRLSEPLPIRGGRARREFRVTAAGGKVLRDARRIATSVWAGAGATRRPEPA